MDNIVDLTEFRENRKAVTPNYDFSDSDNELDDRETELHEFLMLYVFNGAPRSISVYAEDILEANRIIEAIKHSAYYGGEVVKEVS